MAGPGHHQKRGGDSEPRSYSRWIVGEAQIFFCSVVIVQYFRFLREQNHQNARTVDELSISSRSSRKHRTKSAQEYLVRTGIHSLLQRVAPSRCSSQLRNVAASTGDSRHFPPSTAITATWARDTGLGDMQKTEMYRLLSGTVQAF
jgi:hypothetical protein